MEGRRWLRMLGPGLAVAGALVVLGAAAPPGPGGSLASTECADGGKARRATAAARPPATVADLAGTPWYRLDPVLDATGSLVGRRLTVGINGARLDRTLALPAESFAAGPFGGLVLVGSDDGRRSRLLSIDVARGCRSPIAETSDVIRGATVDPAGQSIFEHRVDRSRRADLGLWQRPLDADGPPQRVLGPIPSDPRFGRTWTTSLAWSVEGDRLLAGSCAAVACRTRVLDVASGRLSMTDDPRLGTLVGVTGGRLVAHGACRGLPCPLHVVDLATGRVQTIEAEAGSAVLVGTASAPSLALEVLEDPEPKIRLVGIDGRDSLDLGSLPAGTRLGGDPGVSPSGLRLPPDHILLAPDGQLPDTGQRTQTFLRSLGDGRTTRIDEVTR